MVFVEIFVIKNDGNLLDACGLAAISALKHAKLPAVVKEGDDYKLDLENSAGNLELNSTPITVTVRKGENGILLVDPSRAEEQALPARLTVGSKDDGNISSMQMGGSGQFTPEEIVKVCKMALEISHNIRKAHFR